MIGCIVWYHVYFVSYYSFALFFANSSAVFGPARTTAQNDSTELRVTFYVPVSLELVATNVLLAAPQKMAAAGLIYTNRHFGGVIGHAFRK